MPRNLLAVVVAAVAVAACGSERARDAAPGAAPRADAAPASTASSDARAADRAADSRPAIVVLGDSLTAGLGIPAEQAYPSLLQQRLDREGLNFKVVNAGVSGDTSAGGLSRLDWALQGDVKILIVALGGNDALRGLPTDALRSNLARIIERAQARQIAVVLAGMEAPPNYGRDYIVSFHKVYAELAAQYHVAFVPFLLQNVAGVDTLNQPDGIHPTTAGARMVADNVWPTLKALAEDAR